MQEKARQAISWPEAAGAARREILFLHHMLAAHEASLDQLEAEGERRHLSERARRTEFVTNAREALGLSYCLSPVRVYLNHPSLPQVSQWQILALNGHDVKG